MHDTQWTVEQERNPEVWKPQSFIMGLQANLPKLYALEVGILFIILDSK